MNNTKLSELMKVAEQYLAEAVALNFTDEVDGLLEHCDVFAVLSDKEQDAFTEHLWDTLTATVTVGSVKVYMTNPM